jgi:predicted acylesterase/phospholipase RssA
MSTTANPQPAPDRYCDIVMKGGITSGVVYPPAVVELSKTYTFRNIGGTSAGAIAASVTAAAEYGRQTGNDGFPKIAELPQWLGGTAPNGRGSNLFFLFQPQSQTRSLFRVVIAGIGNKRAKLLRILLAVIANFPLYALLGALPGLLLGYLAYSGFLVWWTVLSAALVFVIGIIGVSAWGLYRKLTTAVPRNGFGICSGFVSPSAGSKKPLSLTPWLSRLLNRLAGMAEQGPPLTFGHLWQQNQPAAERKINLQMLTTNLTHGRPYRLPFAENFFYFDPTEFRQFFPEEVVQWMETHPRETDNPDKYNPLRPLPAAKDLPVVVATRLSLSFPVLLSAIPLYAMDYGRKNPDQHPPDKCWFSDGGICSNFPVHFFDSALPRWPTFAINLRPFHPDYNTPVWMPDRNVGGITEWWTRFDQGSGSQRLAGFAGAILNAMQNWNDNSQTHLPGYRDRVAHVSLDDTKEGGLNLNMPPDVISALSDRGRQAGQMLAERFTSPPSRLDLSWDNHRWVRYRSLMQLLEEMLEEIDSSFSNTTPYEQSYAALIARNGETAPESYRWTNNAQQSFADQATQTLLQLAQSWRQQRSNNANASFDGRVPKPRPKLRVRPPI